MDTIYRCYKGGRFKALTLSYDDGRLADRRLVEILNRYGVKGTFHLNAGLFGDPGRVPADEVKSLYAGHEVSAHTYTHPTIERCPLPMVAQQVLDDRKALEALVDYPVRGLSYPNGSYNQNIVDLLPALGIEYARVVGSTHTFAMPRCFHTWQSTCHHNHDLLKNADRFLALEKSQYQFLMYVWGHSYEFDHDDNWGLIEEFCQKASGKDDIWYATNIEIVDYETAMDRLQFAADGSFAYNPSAMDLWISVNREIVKIPGGQQVNLPTGR